MKKFYQIFILVVLTTVFFAKDSSAWTTYQTIGFQKLQTQLNFSYRFDRHGGFWSEGRLVYGVGEKSDIFAGLGFVRPIESGHGTLGYGVGVKWEILSQAEIIPGLSLITDYRAARPDQEILSWLDLILETGWQKNDWDYYLIFGVTVPKSEESGIFLGAGMIAPLAEIKNSSFSLGLRFNTGTAKQDGYFTFETGLNYLF